MAVGGLALRTSCGLKTGSTTPSHSERGDDVVTGSDVGLVVVCLVVVVAGSVVGRDVTGGRVGGGGGGIYGGVVATMISVVTNSVTFGSCVVANIAVVVNISVV